MIEYSAWLAAWPEAVKLVALIFVPGFVIASALGLKRKQLVAAIPPLSMAAIGVGAILAQRAGVAWGLPFLIGVTIALTLFVGILRFAAEGVRRLSKNPTLRLDTDTVDSLSLGQKLRYLPAFLGPAIATGATVYGYMWAIHNPNRPPQTWDAVFHINAVRWILESGNGSTFWLGTVANTNGKPVFYPAGFHDLAALVYSHDVIVAITIIVLFSSVVLWPLGAALFSSQIMKNNFWVWIIAPMLATCFTAFPERPNSYGTLWPLAFAYSLVPFILTLCVAMMEDHAPNRFNLLVAVAISAVGIGLVHPTGVLVAAIIVIWMLPVHLYRIARGKSETTRAWQVLAWSVIPLIAVGIYLVSKTNAWAATRDFKDREPVGHIRSEILGALTGAQLHEQGFGNTEKVWLLAVLTLLGILILLFKRKYAWLVVSYASVLFLYIVSISLLQPFAPLVGPWYSDPVRLGALVPLVAVVLATAGLSEPLQWWVNTSDPDVLKKQHLLINAVAVILAAVLFVGTGQFARSTGMRQLQTNYEQKREDGLNALVMDDELAMMRRLKGELKPGEKVLGDPLNGSPLVYGVGDVPVVYRHLSGWLNQDLIDASNHFDELLTNPQICATLNKHNIHYLYTDRYEYWPEKAQENYVSLGLQRGKKMILHLKLVDSGGGAAVWRITPCDTPAK